MNFLRRFMYGRYGTDQLSIALLVAGLLTAFIGRLIPVFVVTLIFMIVAYALMFWAVFRVLSKNTAKRYQENCKFLKWFNPIFSKVKTKISEWRDTPHRYFKCPACSKKLRVPAGRGKIEIKCPHCNHKFIKKT